MPRSITQNEVAERLHNYSRDNYLFIGATIKAIALGAATFVVIPILIDFNNCWPKFVLWFVSLMSINVSYVTWGRGLLLTNSRSNLLDHILPAVMGIFEFALFGVLDDKLNEKTPTLWHWWFLVISLQCLIASWLVWNRINLFKKDDFDQPLKSLAKRFQRWLEEDRRGATLIGLISAIFLNILKMFENSQEYNLLCTLFALTLALFFKKPLVNADKQRQLIEGLINRLVKKERRQAYRKR